MAAGDSSKIKSKGRKFEQQVSQMLLDLPEGFSPKVINAVRIEALKVSKRSELSKWAEDVLVIGETNRAKYSALFLPGGRIYKRKAARRSRQAAN